MMTNESAQREHTLDNKASKIASTQREREREWLRACNITIEAKTKRLKVDPLKAIQSNMIWQRARSKPIGKNDGEAERI